MPLGSSLIAPDDAAPLQSFDSGRSLAQIQRHAEILGIRLANLRRMMSGAFVMVTPDGDVGGGLTVVFAHDHPAIRSIAASMLAELGLEVIVTGRRMADLPPDVVIAMILLDVPMASEEYLACVRDARRRWTRVIAATALPEGSARRRLRDAGVVGFVGWPLDARELGECVRNVLNSTSDCAIAGQFK